MRKQVLKKVILMITISLMCSIVIVKEGKAEEGLKKVTFHSKNEITIKKSLPRSLPRFFYDSKVSFTYPDAVRGVYVTGNIAGGYRNYLDFQEGKTKNLYITGAKFKNLVTLMDTTDLNAMVIDIKEDYGYLTYIPEQGSPFSGIAKPYIKDLKGLVQFLEQKQIYPIARIVVFKDTILGKSRPDLSFMQNGKVWTNNNGDAFVNPFIKEVWQRNVEIAKEAAKAGFQEIQFDYVRFPEGFEVRDKTLTYSMGEYANLPGDNVQKRVSAVTDFVAYAKKELEYYNVDVSVDIFGYTATLPEAPGIGQNFSKISEHVDVISSMIYPSHWSFHYFNIPEPDREPYRLVKEYVKVENEKLKQLKNAPISRPWIQDFAAPWLYKSRGKATQNYGKAEVEAQIKALNEAGVNEFLLWNASNVYTTGVDYTPLK